jgi:hypothetical protein
LLSWRPELAHYKKLKIYLLFYGVKIGLLPQGSVQVEGKKEAPRTAVGLKGKQTKGRRRHQNVGQIHNTKAADTSVILRNYGEKSKLHSRKN